jgi:hypothetical protein
MATDIMDKDLNALRNDRWDKAFNSADDEELKLDSVNRKATIVIEHIIQASDVSHTMQHWHIYREWNMRLFSELHKAYCEGRAEVNPADNWYKNEMGFFRFLHYSAGEEAEELWCVWCCGIVRSGNEPDRK